MYDTVSRVAATPSRPAASGTGWAGSGKSSSEDAGTDAKADVRLVAWGSYDKGKPRVRLLLDALRCKGRLAREIHIDIWQGIEDKAVAGKGRMAIAIARALATYPRAILQLLRQPRTLPVLLPYPAILDAFVLWPFARLRRQKIIFDAFIPLHDTIVNDRKWLRRGSLRARLLWQVERLALAMADVVLVDTDEHGRYFSETFGVPAARCITVPVGAEPLFWDERHRADLPPPPAGLPPRYVLFYGQFIPLHGIETILEAALASVGTPVHWLIIGRGQEDAAARTFLDRHAPGNVTWLPWVDYAQLPSIIRGAVISLGIFGTSDKAARVIPNKMFQILAAGGAIITRASPAVAALAQRYPDAIRLVPPGDAPALAEAVAQAFAQPRPAAIAATARAALSPDDGVDALVQLLTLARGEPACRS